ncbi:polysaccharide biosynthesis tyrosine autokinase [Haliscomenobacter sp.]|uniref:GumC family protein n=1 Tax=Haliscomenobacter sp. TaxID=2717303 RepID=UPI003364F14B
MDTLQSAPFNNDGSLSTPSGNKELDLKYFFFLFLRNWYWLLLGLMIGYGIAWLNLRYATNIYQVGGSILLEDNAKSSISEEIITEKLGLEQESNVDDQIQVLKSTTLMRRVVDSLHLNVTYFTVGRVKTSEMYSPNCPVVLVDAAPRVLSYGSSIRLRTLNDYDFILVKGENDTLTCHYDTPFVLNQIQYVLQRRSSTLPGTEFLIRISYPETTAADYANKLVIQPVPGSNVLNLSMRDPVAEKCIDLFKTLVSEFDHSQIEIKNESGRKTLQFIDERLGFITKELYSVEKDVEGYKRSRDLPVAIESKASEYLTKVSSADEQMMELDLRLSMLNAIEKQVNDPAGRYRALPLSSELLANSAASETIKAYNELLQERSSLIVTASASNPAVKALDKKLEELRAPMLDNFVVIRRELNERRNRVAQRLAPIQRKINAIPTYERELLQILRQQQIKEQLFLFLLQKREETALSVAAQVSNTRTLNPPVGLGLVSPDSRRTYTLYLFMGFLIPGIIAFMFDYFNNRVYDESDIKRHTNAPFLGGIMQSSAGKSIVVSQSSRSAIAEMFRMLRTNLQYLAKGESKKVILVSSSVSGEGKSFITINLGISISLSGQKTLLLGLDIRKPKLSRYLTGVQSETGVTNYLVGQATLDEIIKPLPDNPMVDYLDCGPIPPNPAELLMSDTTRQLFIELRKRYEYIIVDTAPIGLVTDALLLNQHIDQTIIVTRFGMSRTPFLRMIQDIYSNKKLPQVGVVLNGLKARAGYGYGYGYGYSSSYGQGYGYGYGSEYFDKETPRRRWSWKSIKRRLKLK